MLFQERKDYIIFEKVKMIWKCFEAYGMDNEEIFAKFNDSRIFFDAYSYAYVGEKESYLNFWCF